MQLLDVFVTKVIEKEKKFSSFFSFHPNPEDAPLDKKIVENLLFAFTKLL